MNLPGEDPAGAVFYLDCNATTQLDPRALEAMEPFLVETFGNPASHHAFGMLAARAVDRAREHIAELVGARSQEIVFTSGGTESNNLALVGVVGGRGGHVVSVASEHKSVLDPLRRLAENGTESTLLLPDGAGWVAPEQVNEAIRPDTLLVSVMAANNELGTVAPIAEIGAVCRQAGVTFHSDAVQLVGKLPFDVEDAGIDLLSMSAHKMYGPKGTGALYVRRGTAVDPIIFGGGHERGLRSGTLNVPGIVGFGAAAMLASEQMRADAEHCERLRSLLLSELSAVFPNLEVNGHVKARLPGTLNVRLPGIDADSLQTAVPRVAVSSGSACTSAAPEPSHVLRAIGRSWNEAQECIRFGMGRFTTKADVAGAVAELRRGVARLRGKRASEVGA